MLLQGLYQAFNCFFYKVFTRLLQGLHKVFTMCVSRFSQGVYKEVVYKAFTICVLQGFYNVFDTSFTMFVYEVFTMSFAGALQDCYNALEGISKDFKLFLEGLYEDFRRLSKYSMFPGLPKAPKVSQYF